MQTIRIQKLTPDDGEDVYLLTQKMPTAENGFGNPAHGLTRDEFAGWLSLMDANARGERLEDWQVAQTIYWLYAGETPVGYAKLRSRLTDSLRIAGGHIGYGIAPEYRGHGYATALLRLVLSEARALGIDEALVTVNPDNLPSRRVVLHCGGVLFEEDAEHCRYWVKTV